jgi:hypothetical protein
MQKAFMPGILAFMAALFFLIAGCQKSIDQKGTDLSLSAQAGDKKNPKNPPPPPPAFSYNCGTYTYSGNFVVGVPAHVTVTFTYTNSPGGSHSGYTSTPVDGITFSTPPGTLSVGSGSITYTASGTPTSTGQYMAIVGLNGFSTAGCGFVMNVLNAPSNCTTSSDPGPAVGSTGCVVFTYKGQQVAYTTVRAADGKIWLQQNLGSPQVAGGMNDNASFGDYFQWGRWDDGHQSLNSPMIAYNSSLSNPAQIAPGNPNYIVSNSYTTGWWSNGVATDTWSGTSMTATNGKDPCTALGTGWRLPSRADWENVKIYEDITSEISAFMCRLKLPSSGYRAGNTIFNAHGNYWSSTASGNGLAYALFFDHNYEAPVQVNYRQTALTCRCVKD